MFQPSRIPALAGVDILWIPTDKEDVVDAIFVCSDLYPEQEWQKTAAEIRHEVTAGSLRGRVLSDNLGPLPQEPQRILKVETFLDHPNMTSQGSGANRELRKAAEAATEVHDVEMTKEQFDMLERPRSGQKLEPREIRQRKRQTRRVTPDGRLVVEEDQGPVEERYIMSFGLIDIG